MALTVSIFISIALYIVWQQGWISKKTLCVCIGVMMFVLIAYRSFLTGGDTLNYLRIFNRLKFSKLETSLENAKDAGYAVLSWVIFNITGDFRVMLVLCAASFSIPYGIYLYRYSENPSLSYTLLYSFNLMQFALTGVRQTFAMGFIIAALIFYKDKKYVRAVIFCLIAMSFHFSSGIVITIPVIAWVFKKKLWIQLSPLPLLGCLALSGSVAPLVINFLFSVSDRMYTGLDDTGGFTMCLTVLIIYSACAFAMTKITEKYGHLELEYAAFFMAAFFETLVTTEAIFFRIAFYGLWMLTIMVPRFVEVIFKEKAVVTVCAYVMALIMYFGFTASSVWNGYEFMWVRA